jgi:uncharacterized membrane protein
MPVNEPIAPHFVWVLLGFLILLAVLSYVIELSTAGDDHPTPDQYWKAGIFYANHDDPALFVRKRSRRGWTLNYGHRWSWAVLALQVLLVLVPILFAALPVLNLIRRVRLHPR